MSKPVKFLLISIGSLYALLTSILYFFLGYSVIIPILWLISIIIFSGYFYLNRPKSKSSIFVRKDIFIIIGLLAIFIPIYLIRLHDIAPQISADEVTIMQTEKLIARNIEVDLFGLSNYFGFPSLFFWIFGKLGMATGGIGLSNMRFLHASIGVFIALFSYIFFRNLGKSRTFSLTGAIFVGINHSLLAISRMAMRDNVPTLLEIICLPLFYLGIKKHDFLLVFLAGVVAGIGFYAYFPARVIPLLCFFYLAIMIFLGKRALLIFNLKVGVVFVLGLGLISNLVFISTFKNLKMAMGFPKEQLLIYPEGRALQQKWVYASTVAEGIRVNIKNGLTLFNNSVVDNGWIYTNRGHGFVDPLTGTLVLLGLLVILWKIKKEKNKSDILILSSFVILMLINSFIVNKAPDYTRVLIILPFAGYLSAIGISTILKRFIHPKWHLSIFGIISLVMVALNLAIYNDFIQDGFKNGDDIGGTVRYVEDYKYKPNYSYYLVYNSVYPFYDYPGHWYDYFMTSGQTSEVIQPEDFKGTEFKKPSTIFMSAGFYLAQKSLLDKNYNYSIKNMTPDGRLIGLEVR